MVGSGPSAQVCACVVTRTGTPAPEDVTRVLGAWVRERLPAYMVPARVRSTADPHLSRWLQPIAHLSAAPMLFPAVERHCTSFSQWWTRATRGLKHAEELL